MSGVFSYVVWFIFFEVVAFGLVGNFCTSLQVSVINVVDIAVIFGYYLCWIGGLSDI